MITITNSGVARLLTLVVDAKPGEKIEQIKLVRELLGTGLKISKDLIEIEHKRREPFDTVSLVGQALRQDGKYQSAY